MTGERSAVDDGWNAGDAYERYMGRWSRAVAHAFIKWLAPDPGLHWLEFGCGTGALTSAICRDAAPSTVVASDPSSSFIAHARASLTDSRVTWIVADSASLPRRPGGFDLVVSGLVLNFVPEPAQLMRDIRARLRSMGAVAAYVWDYALGMEFLNAFWTEAVAEDPAAAALDEARRFPLCEVRALESLFVHAGMREVRTHTLEVPTDFASFDEYWAPFLRGTGPAPSYVASLDPGHRDALRARLARRLGSTGIHLRARALAVTGTSA